jgi:glycogen(starch) synthase
MTADTVGGVFSYCLTLARSLAEPIALATMGGPLSTDQRRELAALEHVEVVESRFKLEWMDDPWDDLLRASQWLEELAWRFRPRLVHLNQYAFSTLRWRAPTVVVGHSCVLSWWRAVHGVEAPAAWQRYRELVKEGLGAAGRVVAPSQAMLSSLGGDYGPLPNARVIWNGCAPERFRPGNKQPLVLAAGRLWDEAKNLAALERVAARLPWTVQVAGEPRRPHETQTPTPPFDSRVERLGHLNSAQMAQALSDAAIYALPARYEPFGLSILEAALSGCALVLGDIPSLRELWDGVARFVDPEDDAALEEALSQLIHDDVGRQRAGEAARARAQRFSPAAMAEAYQALYRELLGEAAACA